MDSDASAAAVPSVSLLRYRLDQLERATERKADRDAVSQLQSDIDSKAEVTDVVKIGTELSGIHAEINSLRKLFFGLIVAVALSAVTVSGTMFIVVAQHVK